MSRRAALLGLGVLLTMAMTMAMVLDVAPRVRGGGDRLEWAPTPPQVSPVLGHEPSVARLTPRQPCRAVCGGEGSYEPEPPRPMPIRLVSPLSWEEIYEVALSTGAGEEWAREAAGVGWCESTGRVDAVGDDGRAYGLWQVHGHLWGEVPSDAYGQAQQALMIYEQSGSWRRWSCG